MFDFHLTETPGAAQFQPGAASEASEAGGGLSRARSVLLGPNEVGRHIGAEPKRSVQMDQGAIERLLHICFIMLCLKLVRSPFSS